MIILIDKKGNETFSGTLCDYDPGDGQTEPPNLIPILELHELEAVLQFVQDSFPKGWSVKDGKLISI